MFKQNVYDKLLIAIGKSCIYVFFNPSTKYMCIDKLIVF